MKKKQNQAKLNADYQSMTLRTPKALLKLMQKKRKETGDSFNKMMNDALEIYLQK